MELLNNLSSPVIRHTSVYWSWQNNNICVSLNNKPLLHQRFDCLLNLVHAPTGSVVVQKILDYNHSYPLIALFVESKYRHEQLSHTSYQIYIGLLKLTEYEYSTIFQEKTNFTLKRPKLSQCIELSNWAC